MIVEYELMFPGDFRKIIGSRYLVIARIGIFATNMIDTICFV